MTYTVTDIAELIRYHLVLASDDNQQADLNLAALVREIESLRTKPLWREVEWYHCDRCECTVDSEVLAHDGSNFTTDGDFLCSSCLYPDEE